jgi:hypothetical protein
MCVYTGPEVPPTILPNAFQTLVQNCASRGKRGTAYECLENAASCGNWQMHILENPMQPFERGLEGRDRLPIGPGAKVGLLDQLSQHSSTAHPRVTLLTKVAARHATATAPDVTTSVPERYTGPIGLDGPPMETTPVEPPESVPTTRNVPPRPANDSMGASPPKCGIVSFSLWPGSSPSHS